MRVYGYARVSTREQSLDIQIAKIQEICKLRNFELIQIFSEKVSGKDTKDRHEFRDMIANLETNPMDIGAVVVYKLDRLGRSLTDLVNTVKFLQDNKIQFISITDNIDTTTSQGRLFFHLMSSIAEFERELIHERTQAGIAKAHQSGKKFGRPKLRIDLAEAKKLMAQGVPKTRICKDFKCSKSYLNKKLAEERTKK